MLSKATDVLNRIEHSPLAVIRTGRQDLPCCGHNTRPHSPVSACIFSLVICQCKASAYLTLGLAGLIEANGALLASDNLHPEERDRLLELLLGDMIVSQDSRLRPLACQLLSRRLHLCALSEELADLPTILRDIEFHLRGAAAPSVKRDIIEVLVSTLHHKDPVNSSCEHWLEALVCSPSLLECVALDLTLSPTHLAMSRQLTNYPSLRALQLTRDSFFQCVPLFYNSAYLSFRPPRSQCDTEILSCLHLQEDV